MTHQYPDQQPYGQPPYAPQPYPPHIGFQPAPPPHTAATVVTAKLGDTSTRMMCPNCRHEIVTATESECSIVQHIAFFVMCISGVCAICSCLPYCLVPWCNVRHECPQCHTHLGSYKRCF